MLRESVIESLEFDVLGPGTKIEAEEYGVRITNGDGTLFLGSYNTLDHIVSDTVAVKVRRAKKPPQKKDDDDA